MIVDDEDIIVSGLGKGDAPRAKYGCEVAATASDGLAAQAVLREKRPDILFTDICMPGADGLALGGCTQRVPGHAGDDPERVPGF